MTVAVGQQGDVLDLLVAARYQEAVATLGSAWPGLAVEPGEIPPELLFAVGILNSNLALTEQEPRAHEVAKNSLSRASRLLKGADHDLCDIQLALAYWRSGDDEEAAIQFLEILERPLSNENRFKALFGYSAVLGSQGHDKEELEWLAKARDLVGDVSAAFRGRFHLESAYNRRRLNGDLDQCLNDYTAALVYFERCNAEILEGSVRNNLAGVYCDLGRFEQAHQHVEVAIQIASKQADKGRLAQCYDQQAQILLAQNLPRRAAQCAHDSVRLCAGATTGWAIECRTTYAKALARIKDPRAIEEFSTAIQIARRQENRNWETQAALTALEELDLDASLMLEWFPLAERSDARKRVNAVRRKLAEKLIALSDYEDVKIALTEHKGNITHAAKSLGYSHHTGLIAYLSKHPELRLKKQYKRAKGPKR